MSPPRRVQSASQPSELDRRILNRLQDGLPVCARPYDVVAASLDISLEVLLQRLQALQDDGLLTCVGPLYRAERLGSGVTLAALRVPPEQADRIIALLLEIPQLVHLEVTDHTYNLWCVLVAEGQDELQHTLQRIADRTGYTPMSLPQQEEFHVGFRFEF